MARRSRSAVGAALAVVMAILAACTSTPRPTASASDPSRAAPRSSSTGQSASPRTSAPPKRPARCTARELSPSIGEHGPASGTENIVILLHNTSARSCLLAGLLPLSATKPDGMIARLRFLASTDPAVAATPATASGSGPVEPGRYGAFLVTECLTAGHKCAATASGKRMTFRLSIASSILISNPTISHAAQPQLADARLRERPPCIRTCRAAALPDLPRCLRASWTGCDLFAMKHAKRIAPRSTDRKCRCA